METTWVHYTSKGCGGRSTKRARCFAIARTPRTSSLVIRDSAPASADAFECLAANSESILSNGRHGPFDLRPERDIYNPRLVVDGTDCRGFADLNAFAVGG